jgi:hypothetical protein
MLHSISDRFRLGTYLVCQYDSSKLNKYYWWIFLYQLASNFKRNMCLIHSVISPTQTN